MEVGVLRPGDLIACRRPDETVHDVAERHSDRQWFSFDAEGGGA